METSKWNLDTQFGASLFANVCTPEAQGYLLRLFKHLQVSDRPVISMLPSGVTPAGAAIAASFYFLPSLRPPPHPHCRIALFPGLHFVSQIKDLKFRLEDIWKAIKQARASGAYAGSVGSFETIRKRIKDHSGVQEVNFHWVFPCQRVWTRHWEKECIDLSPRGYLGAGDPYLPCVYTIESEHLDLFSDTNKPYDLLIYCPYFHSRLTEQTDANLDLLLRKIDSFSAHHKLIIVQSPFDYWSRRLEQKLKVTGIAFAAETMASPHLMRERRGINFRIIDQVIDIGEAFLLNRELIRVWRGGAYNRPALNELKFILSRLLVGLNPLPRKDEGSFDYEMERMLGLAKTLNLDEHTPGWAVLVEIEKRLKAGTFMTKLKHLQEMSGQEKIEIWVTKDDDKALLNDSKRTLGVDMEVRMANRWMAPGLRDPQRKVVLSRIDRLVDLNLVAYLRPRDTIMMSAWEAIIRSGTTMSAWEHSERWREQSKSAGIVPAPFARYADPMLDLANYLDNTISNHLAKLSLEVPVTSGSVPEIVQISWWDSNDKGSLLDSDLDREQLLARTGATSYECREVTFEGGLGMFVRYDAELQVISDDEGEGDIIPIVVTKITPGTTILLFKDSERSSMFDILMDQLERSCEHKEHVALVKDWKERVRLHVLSKELKIHEIVELLNKAGRSFEPLTVRSWIFGPTMAPLRLEHLQLLVKVLDIKSVNATVLFKSVCKLRSIARTLGRVLNSLIIHKNLEEIDGAVREVLSEAHIDVEELSSAVETRVVTGVSDLAIHIEAASIGKLFKVS